jgi:hypothetical protein
MRLGTAQVHDFSLVVAVVLAAMGCQSASDVTVRDVASQMGSSVATTQSTDPADFYALPSIGHITDTDFDRLWTAAEKVSRDYLFTIDLRDRRNGILTTLPNISPQFFEPWRRELQTSDDVYESSLATLRRTIRFKFTRTGDVYALTPFVLVERQAITERRVTGVLSRGYFRTQGGDDRTFSTRETGAGQMLESTYWYPLRRDTALEARLIEAVRVAM